MTQQMTKPVIVAKQDVRRILDSAVQDLEITLSSFMARSTQSAYGVLDALELIRDAIRVDTKKR